MAKLIPAILEKTEKDVWGRVATLKRLDVDMAHLDVMEKPAVNNVCWGDWRAAGELGIDLEVHLMVNDPLRAAEKWLALGNAKRVVVRGEEVSNWKDYAALSAISGGRLGVAFDPETNCYERFKKVDHVHYFLCMGVQSGFSQQTFNEQTLARIIAVKSLPKIQLIGVDGGMNAQTIPAVKQLGVDCIAAASFFWQGTDDDRRRKLEFVEGNRFLLS